MPRVLLQSASSSDTDFLKNLFARHRIECRLASDNINSRSLLTHDSFDLFVMTTPRFYPRDYRFILDLRRQQVSTNVLVLTGKLGFEHFFEHSERKGIHLLEKPFDDVRLMSIVQKLLANPSLRQQRFKRYGTDVLGRVEALLTRRSQDATMRNLSRGGAFLELNGPSRFRVGDLVRLHVQLRDLDRSYSLSGRLVWEASRTAAHDPAGFGMEFVHSQDMYGMLKDRL